MKFIPASSRRLLSICLLAAGSITALILTIIAGHRNSSILLILMFACWVLSPFAGLCFMHFRANRWTDEEQLSIANLIFFIVVVSLVFYSGGDMLLPRGTKPAFIFLVVPLISWVLIFFNALPLFRANKNKQ